MPPPSHFGARAAELDPTLGVRLTAHADGYRAVLPVAHARRLETFWNESAITVACCRYLHGWVMREFAPCRNADTLAFCHQFVAQSLLYGVVAVDVKHTPMRVVPVPVVEIEVVRDEKRGTSKLEAYLRHSESLGRAMRDELARPLEVSVLSMPDVDRLRFRPLLGSALGLHATVRVSRLLQTQIHHRNATRQNYFVRPQGEDAFLRQRTLAHEALAQVMWGQQEAADLDAQMAGAVFTNAEDLSAAVGGRSAQRVNHQQKQFGSAFDVMQCTTLREDIPRFGDFNAMAPLDTGTRIEVLPVTTYAPGLESLADRHELQICACLGVSLEEVRGASVSRLSPYAQTLVLHLVELLSAASPVGLKRKSAREACGVASVGLDNPKDIFAAVGIGLISYERGRQLLGEEADAGLPTPAIEQLPGMRLPAGGSSGGSSSSNKSGSVAPAAKRVKKAGDSSSITA